MWKVLICSVDVLIHGDRRAADRAQAPVNADAKVLADFDERVKHYDDLRNKVDGGAAKQTQTEDPEKIEAQKKALATNIQKARAGAKPGDIFTPEVQPLLKRC